LFNLGVASDDLESTIDRYANPNLVKFAEVLLEKVDKKDFVAGVVGQNIVLEGMAFGVFEMMEATSRQLNPKFAHTLTGTIADERRHVGFGVNRIGGLIAQYPEKKPEIEKMQAEMSYHMLATFSDAFSYTGENVDESRKVAADALAARGEEQETLVWQGADLSVADAKAMEASWRMRCSASSRTGWAASGSTTRPRRCLRPDVEDFDPHQLAEAEFRDEVLSFEFRFQAVDGYLSGHPYGRPETLVDQPLEDDARDRLITSLCNYCVGETSALDGASGMVDLAPNRHAKIFLATQVVDEARHLEVFLHRM
jgi:hypothetical protein